MADDTITNDLINNILAGNFNSAEKIVHQNLAQKQNDLLDQEKIKMAGQIYNNVQPEEAEEVELTDDEIENAIDDEAKEFENDESSEENDEEQE